MKRGRDEQQEVRLPPSVELLLRKICEDQQKPWPDADVIQQLEAQSEASAMDILTKISQSSIRNLGRYIKWMIRQQCTPASSPSPSKTVRSGHVQSAGASSITPQRLHFGTPGEAFGVGEQPCTCNGSLIPHVQVDERIRCEATSDRSPVFGNLPYCYGSPSKATGSCLYQRLSNHALVDERSQEAFHHLPPVRGQSPYSSGSPMKLTDTSSQRLSAPGQLDDRFQGEAFTVLEQPGSNIITRSPYSPVKVAHTYSCQSKFDRKGEAFGVVEQPGSRSGSFVTHVQVDERLRGEAVSDRSRVVEHLPYCYGSPAKMAGSCSYQRLSTQAQVDKRSQGEVFYYLSPVSGQSPYSLGSPMKLAGTSSQRLSAPVQLDDGFQGEALTVLEQPASNNNTQSPYSPVKVTRTCSCQSPSASVARVQLEKRFQGSMTDQPQNPKPRKVQKKVDSYFQKNDAHMTDVPSLDEQEPCASSRVESQPIDANYIERDPGKRPAISAYPINERDEVRRKYIIYGPYQPKLEEYPTHLCGDQDRRFNGEDLTRSSVIDKSEDHGEAHLVALGELEFRRQFLILSYAGGLKLKNHIAAEDIRDWKDLPMVTFESIVWEHLGQKCISTEDRRLNFDWDSGRTHVYHCYVNVDGSYRFKGPYLYKIRRTLLQKELGDDNVLMVKFAKEDVQRGQNSAHHNYSTYMKIAREGILVGLRRYRFLVFKDGGNEEKKKNPTSSPVKCYFVRVASDAAIDKGVCYELSHKMMYEVRRHFMHAHTLPSIDNYMARFSLILSKTTSLKVDWSLVKVEIIDEEYCLDKSGNRIYRDEKPLIHTDGTGFISEDLALLCPKIEAKGQWISDEVMKGLPDPDKLDDMGKSRACLRTEEPPLLIQCRLFHNGSASKGTLLVNKKLQPNSIQIRPSMLKVKTDPTISDNQTLKSLEIVGTSTPPRNTHLSRILIALLVHGGVPEEFFMQILNKALEDSHGVFCKKRAALKVAEKYGEIDDNFLGRLMISFGIPLEESYLRYRLSVLMKEENNSLRKGRLYIPDSYNLMGTADPTGTLKEDEVCVILKDGQLSGKVLVYRYPGLHFGDIHVLKATYVKEMESIVGNAKYGIFFSCKGPRSIADEMGGGDFDGDLYWVSRNPQLLEWYKPSQPWIEASISTIKVPSRSPYDHSREDLEDVLFRSFLTTRFEPSFAMSEAADNWLAWMDQFLTLGDSNIHEKNDVKQKILQLVDLYYAALDAAKKGVKVVVPKELKVLNFPHYMGKNRSYPSTSILGLIYNRVDEHQTEDRSLKEVEKLPAFDENEVPDACLDKWEELYGQYRKEMSSAMHDDDKQSKNHSTDAVIRKYRKILYEANDFEESRRPIEEIYDEAHAIYHVCYDHAKRVGSVKACSFAWRVAGKALCQLHARNTNETFCTIVSSVLKEIL